MLGVCHHRGTPLDHRNIGFWRYSTLKDNISPSGSLPPCVLSNPWLKIFMGNPKRLAMVGQFRQFGKQWKQITSITITECCFESKSIRTTSEFYIT